ncbi:MAG: hypothetical protein QXG03_00445 [Halalkalicoccus sp.]
MSSEDSKPDDLQTVLDRLEAYAADESRLVSVYVPPDRLIDETIVFLGDEHGEAGAIDCEDRRRDVRRALIRLQDELATYDEPPEHGLALFCGRLDGKWVEETVETPRPVGTFRYERDETFHTEAVRELLAPEE